MVGFDLTRAEAAHYIGDGGEDGAATLGHGKLQKISSFDGPGSGSSGGAKALGGVKVAVRLPSQGYAPAFPSDEFDVFAFCKHWSILLIF